MQVLRSGLISSPFDVRARIGAAAIVFGVPSVATGNASAQAPQRSGKQVVEQTCVSCHRDGRDGAPRIGDAKAWAKRASQGLRAKLSQVGAPGWGATVKSGVWGELIKRRPARFECERI